MEHLLLKAVTTATGADQGTFEAVISTASVDREGDIVEPLAIVNALAKWVKVGKLVPLAWAHGEDVVGHIEPGSARIEGKEVVVKGWIDQATDLGKEAWRLVKSGTLSFSYGFLVPDGGATKRRGAEHGSHITALDLFEISVVPIAPANNETRVLSFKSLDTPPQEGLRVLASEVEAGGLTDPEQMARLLREVADSVEKKLSQDTITKETADETDKEPAARSVDPLRKQAESLALEFASGGLSLQRPPRKVEQTKREPELPLADLKRRMRDEILIHLSGDTI
jgi:HK97 family phage prohead protease